MKKFMSVILTLCMVLSLLPAVSGGAAAEKIVASGTCGAEGDGGNLTWTLDSEGTLTISGTGKVGYYSLVESPWYAYRYDIKTICFGNGVTGLNNSCFSYVANLDHFAVGADNQNLAVDDDGVLFNKSMTTLFSYPTGNKETNYIIPDGVKTLASGSFEICTFLKNVFIPDSVSSVSGAFSYSTGLCGITVDSNNPNFSSDSDGALFNKAATKLFQYPIGNSRDSYIIPQTVTAIGRCAFSCCSGIHNITIPGSVIEIGDYAFSECNNLATIDLPDSIVSIGSYAFFSCQKLKSIMIPKSTTKIGDAPFNACSSLLSITVNTENEKYASENGALFNKARTILIQYSIGRPDTTYTVPNSVVSISNHAFCCCNNIESIFMGNESPSIGAWAFGNCGNLHGAFFKNCPPVSVDDSAFIHCASDFTIYYPDGASGWSTPTWKGYKTMPYTPTFTETTPAADKTPEINTSHYYSTPEKRLFRIFAAGATYPAPTGFKVQVGANSFTSGQTGGSTSDDINVTVPAGYAGDIVISKDGYYSYTMPAEQAGAYTAVTMTPTTVKTPFAQALLADKSRGDTAVFTNLLADSEQLYAVGISGSPESRRLYVSVNWSGHGDGTVWLQQGEKNAALTNNAYTDVSFDAGFVANQTVFLCAKAGDGTTMKIKTGLKIYEKKNSGIKLNLGESVSVPTDENDKKTAILPNDSIKFDLSELPDNIPMEFTIKTDGTIEGVIGAKSSENKDKKAAYGSIKEVLTKTLGKNQSDGSEELAEYFDQLKDDGAWPTEANGSVGYKGKFKFLGYFTGNYTNEHVLINQIKLAVMYDGKLTYTYNFFVGVVPAYFSGSLAAKIGASISAKYDEEKNVISVDSKTPFNGKFSVSLEVGPGSKDILSGAVQGKGTFGIYTAFPLNMDCTQLTVQGQLSFVGTCFGMSGEWSLYKQPEMIFWENGNRVWKSKDEAGLSEVFVPDLTSYPMLMETGTASDGAVASGVSGYTAPCLTRLSDGRLLAVWAADVSGRKAVDKTGLYYSLRGTNGTWSAAKLVWDDGTNDSVPELHTVGSDIWLTWQNYTTVFNSDTIDNISYDTVSAQIDVAAAKFDTASGTFGAGTGLPCSGFDRSPQLSMQNGTLTMAWTNGDGGLYTATYGGSTWSAPTAQSAVPWYSAETALPSTYKGEAPVTTTTRQVFSTLDYQAILYTAESGTGVNDVYGLFNDGSGWGDPVQLTAVSGGSIGGFQAAMDDSGEHVTILATVRRSDSSGNYTGADLKTFTKALTPDLSVSDADYVRDSFVPGQTLTLKAAVTNNSGRTVSGLQYSVKDGTAVLSSGNCDVTLLPGQRKTVYVNYALPADFALSKLTLGILPGSGTDADTADNSADCTFMTSDLSVENVAASQTPGGTEVIMQLVNRGHSDSGDFSVTLHKDTPDGSILKTQTVSSLKAGEAANVIVEAAGLGAGEMVYVEAQALANENLLGNNTSQAVVLSAPKSGLSLDVKSSRSGGTLTLSASADNNTGDAVSCRLVAAAYDQNGKMLSVKTLDGLSVASLQSDGGTVSLTVPASGAVRWKVLVLNSADNSPLADAAEGTAA